MYWNHPIWYRDGLPEILTRFSSELMRDKPINLLPLPSFPTPSFEDDGVHLTAYSGLEFVLHLFDSSCSILDSLELDPGLKLTHNRESTRLLEDRMVALEQDHRRLNSVVDLKIAIDAEQNDIIINERNEDSFVIFGLPRIPSSITGKPWQERAKKDLQVVIRDLIGHECSVVVIQNITSHIPDAEVRYKVKLTTVAESKEIRDKFGKFFSGPIRPGSSRNDSRPESLKGISIRNLLTQESRVRLSLLHLYAKRYLASNPGSTTKVIGWGNQPILKIIPAEGASDKRVKVFTFIDTVQKLSSNFTPEELKFTLDQVRNQSKFTGKLKSLFVVISDDMISRHGPKPSSTGAATSGSGQSDTRKRGAESGNSGKNKSKSQKK